MKYYAGIDLGGTNIVVGIVDENYNIVAKADTRTNAPRSAEEICKDMAATYEQAVINSGVDKKEAIKQVAKLRNIPKRDVYSEYKLK